MTGADSLITPGDLVSLKTHILTLARNPEMRVSMVRPGANGLMSGMTSNVY